MNKPHDPTEAMRKKLEALASPKRFFKKRKKIPYASFNLRSLAFMIDYGLFLAILYIPLYHLARILFGQQKAAVFYVMGMPLDPQEQMAVLMSPGFVGDWILNNLMTVLIVGAPIVFLWLRYANTPGLWLFRIRIVDEESWERPSISQFLWRYAGWFLPVIPAWAWLMIFPPAHLIAYLPVVAILSLGFCWILIDPLKQGWHDKLSRTLVVKVNHWRWHWEPIEKPSEDDEKAVEADDTPGKA